MEEKQYLSKLILLEYNLFNLNDIKKLNGGQGDVFEINTQSGDFIFKIYGFKNKIVNKYKINETIKLLDFLSKNNFPYLLPIPLKRKNGLRIVRTKIGYGVLYKKIEGYMIKKINSNEVVKIARLQALFHKITNNFKHKKKIERFHKFVTLHQFKRYYEKYDSKIENKNYFLSNLKFIKKASDLANNMIIKSGGGIIHSDINTFNILFDKGKIKGILDFENYNFTSRIFDIGYTIKMTCFKNNKIDFKLTKKFLKEYSKILPLPENYEYNLLPVILLDNCIYFIRAYENNRKRELYETVETSKFLYPLLKSKENFAKSVTLIKLSY